MTAAPTTTHTLHTGEWLELRREGHWEYAHRTGGHRAVMIIAVTDDDELVFVEQPRIPVHARTIEIPAGLVGDTHASDTPHEAARRELLEETGFEAARLEEIDGNNNILTDPMVVVALAQDAQAIRMEHQIPEKFWLKVAK